MATDYLKWLYSFTLLLITVGWAVFTVMVVRAAMSMPTASGILEASGTGVLLGALIGWNALIIQYWFRKKTPS